MKQVGKKMMDQNITAKFEEAIKTVIEEYQKKEFTYLTERDIQARLYCLLRNSVDRTINARLQPFTKRGAGKWPLVPASILHCEMPVPNTKPRERFDIGVWGYGERSNLKEKIEYTDKEVSHAIEIKYYWKYGLTKNIRGDIEKDLNKIDETNAQGFILCFLISKRKFTDSEKQYMRSFWKEICSKCRQRHRFYIIDFDDYVVV